MTRNIIIIAIVVIILGLGAKFFFSGDTTQEIGLSTTTGLPLLNNDMVTTENVGFGSDFLTALLNLKTLRLDDSVFRKESFKGLQDFSEDLIQTEPEGRPNPFAPIGSDSEVVVPGSPIEPIKTTGSGIQSSGSVTTNSVSNITNTTATFSGVTNIPNSSDLKTSFWLGTTEETKSHVDASNFSETDGSFSLPITNLRSGVKYYVRAVVSVGGQNTLGEIVSFTTLSK